MSSIEAYANLLLQLEPCVGEERSAHTLVPERLHLARGPDDSIELFVEGDRESFGVTAVGRSLEWGRFRDRGGSRDFEALVIRAIDASGSIRLMAHLAYEANEIVCRKPSIGNDELIKTLSPFIALVIQRMLLSPNHQMGLTAELMLLFELLNFCDRSVPPIDRRLALSAWKGWDAASRDFLGRSAAVEAKATGQDARRHQVHSIHQLVAGQDRPDERVYIYSVGLRPDRSRTFRLLEAFDRVATLLKGDETESFLTWIRRYGGEGFDPGLRAHYELETGFSVSQPPRLYRVDHLSDILRPESFVGGAVPARASRLTYEVSLEGLPACQPDERDWVLRDLLGQL